MKSSFKKLEGLFQDNILLYKDLVEMLKHEKECISNKDIDSLWKLTDQKKELTLNIEKNRKNTLRTLSESSIVHGMNLLNFSTSKILELVPEAVKETLRPLHLSLSGLADEVRTLAKLNKDYVNEYLRAIDDIIGVIANVEKQKTTYHANYFPEDKKQTNLILHKEA